MGSAKPAAAPLQESGIDSAGRCVSIPRRRGSSCAQGHDMKISFAEFALPQSGAIVVGAWEERVLTEPARRLDEATGGAVSRAVAAAARFRGKKNELVPIIGPPELGLSRIVVAGLGKPEA